MAYRAAKRDGDPAEVEFARKRASELRRYFREGWGVLDNDKQGRGMFAVLVHTIAHTGSDLASKMTAAWREFAPWLSERDFQRMAFEAISVRRTWTADKLAHRIGLTYADRQRLGIRTIGAIDVPKDERDQLREARKVEAKRAKRRGAGVRPREEYEADSLSRTKPWEAEGVSRATWYRRQKAVRQVRPQYKDSYVVGVRPVSHDRPQATGGSGPSRAVTRAEAVCGTAQGRPGGACGRSLPNHSPGSPTAPAAWWPVAGLGRTIPTRTTHPLEVW